MVTPGHIKFELVAHEPIIPVAPSRVAMSCRCPPAGRAQQIEVALLDFIIADFDYCPGAPPGQVNIGGASVHDTNLVFGLELATHFLNTKISSYFICSTSGFFW